MLFSQFASSSPHFILSYWPWAFLLSQNQSEIEDRWRTERWRRPSIHIVHPFMLSLIELSFPYPFLYVFFIFQKVIVTFCRTHSLIFPDGPVRGKVGWKFWVYLEEELKSGQGRSFLSSFVCWSGRKSRSHWASVVLSLKPLRESVLHVTLTAYLWSTAVYWVIVMEKVGLSTWSNMQWRRQVFAPSTVTWREHGNLAGGASRWDWNVVLGHLKVSLQD